MKPTIYLPEPRIPRGWLVEAIKQWRAQRIKGKSTKALHVRLEALKARYSKA